MLGPLDGNLKKKKNKAEYIYILSSIFKTLDQTFLPKIKRKAILRRVKIKRKRGGYKQIKSIEDSCGKLGYKSERNITDGLDYSQGAEGPIVEGKYL